MTHTETVIALRDLSKSYGGPPVLDGLTLSVQPGILALLGPNGAGKTTLINILSTLIRPDAGTATVLGHDVVAERRVVQSLIGVTGQYAAVDEMLTGTENLVMMGRLLALSGRAARRRAAELLEAFDLVQASGRTVKTYSGGMRRRLDLAVSLIRSPAVMFLDEPTTGLDTRSRQALWSQVRRLADDGTTVLLTTQYLDEADALADRVAVLDGGRIIADGHPEELKSTVGTDIVEIVDERGTLVRSIPTDGTAAGIAGTLTALPADARVRVRRPTLDEVFLALTGAASGSCPHGHDDAPTDPERIPA